MFWASWIESVKTIEFALNFLVRFLWELELLQLGAKRCKLTVTFWPLAKLALYCFHLLTQVKLTLSL